MTTSRSITVAAGQSVDCAFIGSLIVIKDASFAFQLTINDGEVFDVEGGITLRRSYQKIKVTNPSSTTALVVSLYLGKDGVDYQFFRERSTLTVTTQKSVSAGSTSAVIPGVDSSGRRRRTAILNNLDGTALIYLSNSFGVPYAICPALTAVQIDTDADLYIYNTGGSGITCSICEIWYA